MADDDSELPAAPRIAPLSTLPIFLKLGGRRVLVAGGSEPALWKCELLAAAGADVEAIADHFCEAFEAQSRERVRLVRRPWRPADLDGAAIAIGAMTDDGEALRFTEAARVRGIPCNVVDRPRFCDFQFGAIANRSPLVIAVSTNGAAPVLGQALRSQFEAMLPEKLGSWVEAAARWRPRLAAAGCPSSERRKFWTRFAKRALEEGGRPPLECDFEELRGDAMRPAPVSVIALPSADPDLLTLAAVRVLKSADVVICHSNMPAVLDFARREALRLPSRGSGPAKIARMVSDGLRIVMIVEPQDRASTLGTLSREGVTVDVVPVATPAAP